MARKDTGKYSPQELMDGLMEQGWTYKSASVVRSMWATRKTRLGFSLCVFAFLQARAARLEG